MRVVVSCEHGGNELPPRWAPLGEGRSELLRSHRGWDPGALELARGIADRLAASLVFETTSRLLVELNRSPGHPRLFSELARDLPPEEREILLREIYHPYRGRVEATIAEALETTGRVLHLSAHTFTPEWQGVERGIDIGLLYDPRRERERAFCDAWRGRIRTALPGLRVRRNAPYRGAADGLTTALRRRFPADRYLGIELEVSQRFPLAGGEEWETLQEQLAATLAATVAEPGAELAR